MICFQEPIDINTGIQDSQAMDMAKNLGFDGSKQKAAAEQIKRLYKLFIDVDATQVEINPFGETGEGEGLVQFQVVSIHASQTTQKFCTPCTGVYSHHFVFRSQQFANILQLYALMPS